MMSVMFVIIGVGLMTTFLTGQKTYVFADAYVQAQQESRRAFDVIVRELREAQLSAGSPTTNLANGSVQLNFQIARGYNVTTDPACPLGAICWGNDTTSTTGWLHYAIVGAAGNSRQLIRCNNTSESGAITAFGTGCRVLANSVRHPNTAGSAVFVWNAVTEEVTANIQIEHVNPTIPDGRVTSQLLTATVRLRN